ncbi:hypothetical protein G7Y89_g9046 [Cudoniella acicularis]|uniref:Uncharacterized protein n=1 Tax=Cudoniella acicularis TaxID=354080 RepID=A0A8H4RFE4_9HELO|nr:hypothetical protein G7Y89_g9046 [Cudoniella acicularis]
MGTTHYPSRSLPLGPSEEPSKDKEAGQVGTHLSSSTSQPDTVAKLANNEVEGGSSTAPLSTSTLPSSEGANAGSEMKKGDARSSKASKKIVPAKGNY